MEQQTRFNLRVAPRQTQGLFGRYTQQRAGGVGAHSGNRFMVSQQGFLAEVITRL